MWSFSFVVLSDLRRDVIVRFVNISGMVAHHCLDVIVRFVDIGGIVDHY